MPTQKSTARLSKKPPLSPEELKQIDAYWRAANYLTACQLYLLDNPLLERPLCESDLKQTIVGHWGTCPGQNFIYTHLDRVIKRDDLDMIYLSGPGHGGNAMVAQDWLDGSYTEIYPNITRDKDGMKKLFKRFSFPGGIPSHVAPETPGSIHEGGELGYSLAHAFGAVADNPSLIAACVVGDGEAETGLDHRVGRKGIHRGKFEIRRDAAARENARVEDFANSFGDSGSAATSVLVAQNRGAGKEERVKESFRSSLFLMLAMGLAMSLIMYVSASTSVGFMLGTRSGAAFENARDYLKLVALFYTLCFTGNTFAGYFNGIGKVSVPFLGATSHIALRVVLSWLLVGKMGLPAVALATGLGWVLVNALWTFVKWRMEKKQKAAERDIM